MAAGKTERRFERQELDVDILLSDKQYPGQLIFTSSDISPGGVFLKSDLLLEVGERFNLEFQLPGMERKIGVAGRIVRAEKSSAGAGPGMGVEFLNLKEEDMTAIIRFASGS